MATAGCCPPPLTHTCTRRRPSHTPTQQEHAASTCSKHMHPLLLLPCTPLALQVEADKWQRAGKQWPPEEEAAFRAAIQQRYDQEGSPYYASARLWDDGVIDPADTRRVVGMALAAALNAPPTESRYGVFRM